MAIDVYAKHQRQGIDRLEELRRNFGDCSPWGRPVDAEGPPTRTSRWPLTPPKTITHAMTVGRSWTVDLLLARASPCVHVQMRASGHASRAQWFSHRSAPRVDRIAHRRGLRVEFVHVLLRMHPVHDLRPDAHVAGDRRHICLRERGRRAAPGCSRGTDCGAPAAQRMRGRSDLGPATPPSPRDLTTAGHLVSRGASCYRLASRAELQSGGFSRRAVPTGRRDRPAARPCTRRG